MNTHQASEWPGGLATISGGLILQLLANILSNVASQSSGDLAGLIKMWPCIPQTAAKIQGSQLLALLMMTALTKMERKIRATPMMRNSIRSSLEHGTKEKPTASSIISRNFKICKTPAAGL